MSAMNQVLLIVGRMAVDESIRCISPDGSSCLFVCFFMVEGLVW